jgi:hypothetical protein
MSERDSGSLLLGPTFLGDGNDPYFGRHGWRGSDWNDLPFQKGMEMKKQIKTPRLPAEMRRAMLRNAAGKHPDKKKIQNKKAARKKVSKSDW